MSKRVWNFNQQFRKISKQWHWHIITQWNLKTYKSWIKKYCCTRFTMLSSMLKNLWVNLRSILPSKIWKMRSESLLRVPLWLDYVNCKCVSIYIRWIRNILWLSIWGRCKQWYLILMLPVIFLLRSNKFKLYCTFHPNEAYWGQIKLTMKHNESTITLSQLLWLFNHVFFSVVI